MSDQDTTITADALEQMLDQFDGSVNLRLLAASFLDQVQQFEDDIWPLLAERSLALATGHRLDGLGQIADLNRSGRNDADYRLALTAEFAVLQSNGTAEELITIAQLMVQMGTADYEVIEYYPKGFYIRPVDFALTVDPDLVGTMLDRAVSAATAMSFVYSQVVDAYTFTLSSQGAVTESSALLGLGDAITGGGPYIYEANVGTGGGFADGDLRFNAVDISAATVCHVQHTDMSVTDQTSFLNGLLNDYVYVLSDAGDGVFFQCSGTTNQGNYHDLDMNVLAIRMQGDPLTDQTAVKIRAATTGGGWLSGVK